MSLPARTRDWFLRLALTGLLLGVFAPVVAQARMAVRAGSAGWIEVCSPGQTRWLRLDAAGEVLEQSDTRPDDAPSSLHDGMCLGCLPQGVGAPPPAAPGDGLRLLPLAQGSPATAVAPGAGVSRPWSWPALRAPPRP